METNVMGNAVSPLTSSGLQVPVSFLGTGMYIPDAIVSNRDMTNWLDTTDEWIVTKTGIRERRFLEKGKYTSDMCIGAAKQALYNGGIHPKDLDAIVVSTFTFDQLLPSTALIVKDALGADQAIPIDLNQAACAGGIYGIWLGCHLLQNEKIKNVLVIGAECMSRITDPLDRTTRVFFGDAAGALILGKAEEGYGLLSWDIQSSLSYSVEVPSGGSKHPTSESSVAARGQYLKMDGRTVWKEATKQLPKTMLTTAQRANLEIGDIDHFFIHQANLNILKKVMESLQQPMEKTIVNVERLGNTGAATVFTVLHEAMERKVIHHGNYMMIAGIGAGFLWGSLCLRYFNQT
ncbi:3-oxoacyl-ACP synthase III family protein [Desmospora activa]|uniref:3-oxoacyl-[acyl-carrier-protein] synthase-3 n=1 Tax=Desmospora activa DSM 45169 TaxID=1121389 RepID=A0A2T4ZAE1_9BACL|nr:ketoacyl-ACP synthase III [Desmospora activa]PTM58836.1 3-oxoacyl-[acyl-carrier-protein] synthase-3 [Desmospora activa DSM 45169]